MKKILIIDDDPTIRIYLKNLLKDNGYDAAVAEDAKKAMELVDSESFDLITLDLDMPGEWGTRFFGKLAQDKKKKNIPVIVISGMSGNEYAIPRAVASLTKPFDQKELLKIIRDVLK
ncbi:MAG: response regulator [Desulfobacula sp.]|jgi:DNA-binding response OmpR family regulator